MKAIGRCSFSFMTYTPPHSHNVLDSANQGYLKYSFFSPLNYPLAHSPFYLSPNTSIYLSIYLWIYLSISLSIYLSIYLSFVLSIHPSHTSIIKMFHPSFDHSIHPSIQPAIHPTIHPSHPSIQYLQSSSFDDDNFESGRKTLA